MRFIVELELDEPTFQGPYQRLEIRKFLHKIGNGIVDQDSWGTWTRAYVEDRDGNEVGEWRFEQ